MPGGPPDDNGAARAPIPPRARSVQPAPVPTIVAVSPMANSKLVAIVVSTPVGMAYYFLEPDAARGVAEALAAAAGLAESGLIVPPPGPAAP